MAKVERKPLPPVDPKFEYVVTLSGEEAAALHEVLRMRGPRLDSLYDELRHASPDHLLRFW